MGYLIVANGMPVGYGGASAVFSQANTGINMFEEYRGSEAPYLWVQVLRAYRHMFRCTRFIVNPYQIGAGNPEALKSGALWFYYRLGFRPVEPHIASLAAREMSRINSRRGYRSDVQTLRQLTRCDMQLRLRGAANSDYFNEEWVEVCAAGASSVLARQRAAERRAAARQAAKELMETLGTASVENWSRSEREALLRLAPIMSLVPDLEDWSRREKADLVRLMRAKGGDDERAYIQRLRAHRRLQRGLARYCRSRCA
jgi:hypothetical protein